MTPGVTLYVVRHGETDWNAALRLQGQTDVPLNDRGRGQAARNGRALREILSAQPDLQFISSPLLRTVETMDIMRRELALPAKAYPTDARLKEIAFGIWEGKTILTVSSMPRASAGSTIPTFGSPRAVRATRNYQSVWRAGSAPSPAAALW